MPQMSAFASLKARAARKDQLKLLGTYELDGSTNGRKSPQEAAIPSNQISAVKRGPPSTTVRTSKRPRNQVDGKRQPIPKSQEDSSIASSPVIGAESSTEEDSDVAKTTSDQADCELSRLATPINVRELDHGATYYVLRPDDQLTLIGQYKIWVKIGFVSIMGALIHAGPRSHTVFAPSTHSLPIIKHVKPPPTHPNPNAEVIIEVAHTGLRGLGRLSRNFKDLWNHQDGTSRSYSYLKRSSDDPKGRSLRTLLEPAPWHTAAANIARRAHEAPVIVVCGPLNCGKSSFARVLINRMITYPKSDFVRNNGVEFLDLDPGQPEYSPPGEIALMKIMDLNLGPPYSHPVLQTEERNKLIRAHHIADTTPANDVEHYLDCVADLFSKHDPTLPLIINGCGWTRDMGLEVMERVIQSLTFTDIVIFSKAGVDSAPSDLDQMVKRVTKPTATVHRFQFEPYKGHPARKLRQMQAMSYFHSEEPIYLTPSWDYQRLSPISEQTLRWGGETPDIDGIVVYDNYINPSSLKTIINGNTCALVAVEDSTLLVNGVPEQLTNDQLPYLFLGHGAACDPLDPRKSRSLGQVLIQRIEGSTQTLYVNTPLDLHDLVFRYRDAGHLLVLVHGRLEAPGWAYTEAHYEAESKKKDLAAWIAFRQDQIRIAGGTLSPDGIRGPNGEDWSTEEVLDLPVEGEDEFGGENTELETTWVEVGERNPAETALVRDAVKAGGKRWKVRRNLVVGEGS